MVEIFFGIITRQAIRRGTFRSVQELTAAIGAFIDAYNDRCRPFTWTKDADQLIGKIKPSRELRSVRDFARKEWPLRGSPADVSGTGALRSAGG